MGSRAGTEVIDGSAVGVGEVPSPLGPIVVAGTEDALMALVFADHWRRYEARLSRRLSGPPRAGVPEAHTRRLERYFAGEVGAFAGCPIDPGGTEFQRRVWEALRAIPAGSTRSYRAIAGAIGSAGADRAVGTANGANPVWIAVPCHRVIRSDGALGGYGGGLDRKRWLLDHEARHRRSGVTPG